MNERKRAARIAGLIYLSMILIAPYSLMYVPAKLFVRGDAAATATNVLAHQTMFLVGIAGAVTGGLVFICLAFALYRLLSDVNKTWAQLMVGLVLVSSAIGLCNTVNHLAALSLFKGGQFLDVIDPAQRNALGMFFVRLHWQADVVNEVLWGAWLFPFGLLVYHSGFLPRFIGLWLVANCFAWVVICFVGLFAPSRYDSAFAMAQPFMFGELAIMFWLLIKGAKVREPAGIATPMVAA